MIRTASKTKLLYQLFMSNQQSQTKCFKIDLIVISCGIGFMAFNFLMQIAVSTITKNLRKNPTVIELGNQRFRYSDACLTHCEKTSGKTIRRPVDYVWEFFEDIGFSSYQAIDVNTELKSIAMDLNFNLKEKYSYTDTFDLVTNNGTGEHIFDQKAVFENMHNLCKVGGVMINVLPFAPWLNHGFYNFNPNLFRDVAAANEYKWNFLWLGQNTGLHAEVPFDIKSWGFHENKHPYKPASNLEKLFQHLHNQNNSKTNISLVCAYTKTKDAPFQIPMQGRYVNDVSSSLKESYSDSNTDTRQKDHTSSFY